MNNGPPAVFPASQPGTPPANGEQGNERTTASIRYLDGPDGRLIEMVSIDRARELIDQGRARPILRRGKLYRISRVPSTRPILKPLSGFSASTFSPGATLDAGEHNDRVCKDYPHYRQSSRTARVLSCPQTC